MAEKIILDVDTGTDDAVALCMAMLDESFDLLGVCTVNGNLELKLTTDNTLRVVECCKKQQTVGVYRGSDLPLVSTLEYNNPVAMYPLPRREGSARGIAIHTEHLPLPEPTLKVREQCATVWLIETLLAQPDASVTLVPLGPVTNIALALRADTRIVKKIKRVVLMGGGNEISNASAAAEFNVFADPEAMEILLQSGCEIIMVPLDATHRVCLSMQDAQDIRGIGTAPARLIADIVEERIRAYSKREDLGAAVTPLHDALAVCCVVLPQVITDSVKCSCRVDLGKGAAYGRTVLDLRPRYDMPLPNCTFVRNADRDMFMDWMTRVLIKDKDNTSVDE